MNPGTAARPIRAWLLTSLLIWAAPESTHAAEPPVTPTDLPRRPAIEPADAPATFELHPAFRAQIVAAEPLIADPVAAAYDENSRLYVVEMRDYSERRDERMGRIRLLEDLNRDGVYDQGYTFAEDLPWPTAVVCYDGGVFVGATPDILYLKDTDGDRRADIRRVVFTGFGSLMDRLNVQQLLNSFQWGLDNRIHGALGGNAGVVRRPDAPDLPPLELRGRDFSFNPRTLDLRPETGGAQHGMTFDDQGRRFVCSNSDHLQQIMADDRYLRRTPGFSGPSPRISIAADGPAAPVFRRSPEEPWRVIRTRWRVTGVVPGIVEGGGKPSGYFTGATGTTLYRGDAWPDRYRGDAFIADCGSNLIHHKKLRRNGLEFVGERPPEETHREFLASTDNWFRPVQFVNAPDGTLHVLDMYRETIEHPWSIPESIKQHLDLNSGNNRGRIYRILPVDSKPRRLPRLANETTRQLVRLLDHPNAWHRDTASRLLFERADRNAIPFLRSLLRRSSHELGRIHALRALESFKALSPDDLALALRDPSPAVRRHAIQLGEQFTPTLDQPPTPDSFSARWLAPATDPSIDVRYQLAFSLGEAPFPAVLPAFSSLARRDGADPWIRMALLSGIRTNGLAALAALLQPAPQDPSTPDPMLHDLARLLGVQRLETPALVQIRARETLLPLQSLRALLAGLDTGLRQAGTALRLDPGAFQPAFDRALQTLEQPAPDATRSTAAVHLLGLSESGYPQTLLAVIRANHPVDLRLAALQTLARRWTEHTAATLAAEFNTLPAPLQDELIRLLAARAQTLPVLLTALQARQIPVVRLPADLANRLRNHSNPAIRDQARKLLGAPADADRRAVLTQYLPALELEGNRDRGRALFLERCASCHRLDGDGATVGPDLASTRANGPEKLLVSLLDPNREIATAYIAYSAEIDGEEPLSGIVSGETDTTITLKQAQGLETVLTKARLKSLNATGKSLMPEGLEQGLTPAAMADLLAYLTGPIP